MQWINQASWLRVSAVIAVLSLSQAALADASSGDCAPAWPDKRLLALKDANFALPADVSVDSVARAFLGCIGHANPAIRDGVVFAAYQHWLRAGLVTPAMASQVQAVLLANLAGSDKDPLFFRSSFAALILAETVRMDRIQPYLTSAQRQSVVDGISRFIRNIADYRGFTDAEGWRHAVAHSADVVLQLSLNPAVTPTQGLQLLQALLSQVAPSTHFYHFGEAKRLALPSLYLLLRQKVSREQLLAQWQTLAQPAPFADWSAVYQSEAGLAKLHNTRSYFAELLVLLSSADNPELQALQAPVLEILKSLG